MYDLGWSTVFIGLFLYSLSFALLAQKALGYLRKWLLCPTIFVESLVDVIESLRTPRMVRREDSVVNLIAVSVHLLVATTFIIMTFMFSAIGISSVISSLVAPANATGTQNFQFVEGAVIMGALVALMTRIFSVQISDALIKGVFFQGSTVIAAYAMLFLIQPQSFYEAYLSPSLMVAFKLWTGQFLPTVFIIFFTTFFAMEVLAFARSPPISMGLFRERLESLETGPQCLLKGQIISAVKEILGSYPRLRTIRWATGGGFEELKTYIFPKCDNQTIVRFIASAETINEWRNIANDMIPYTRVSQDVGFVRFMVINDEVLIEVLPMPDGKDSNTGIVIRHPLIVQERILVFDNWYNQLPSPQP